MLRSLERAEGASKKFRATIKTGTIFTLGAATGYLAGRSFDEALQHRKRLNTTGELTDTIDRTIKYYEKSQRYLNGPLKGTCHFGYTEINQPFNLTESLHEMEVQLAQAIGLAPGSTILDAGCGFGHVATTMAKEFGYNVVGVDLVTQRAEEARRFAQEHGVADRVTIHQGNYSRLPLQDNSVDAVYTMETLCHSSDLDATLTEFHRVLRPGGRLVNFEYSMPPPESLGRVHKKVANTMIKNIGMDSMEKFTHGAFPSLIEPAGFEQISVRDASQNVWPTWHYLFQLAIKEKGGSIIPKILGGSLTDKPNLAGALIIWPYRHNLRYNIITANKPA